MNIVHTLKIKKQIAVIVAHPDDETLWCGGTILSFPDADWFVVCLCRKDDVNRAPKFKKVLSFLNAKGIMGDIDDGPEQIPLKAKQLKDTIVELLPYKHFDLVITHDPSGEYTRHRRHEEIGQAVIELWHFNKISTKELWTFAYEDGNKTYLPKKQNKAQVNIVLSEEIFNLKYKLITEFYGFHPNSFEARTTPKEEAFWRFKTTGDALTWLKKSVVTNINE